MCDWFSCLEKALPVDATQVNLGSFRLPIKLFFNRVVVRWTWGRVHLQLGTLGGSTQGAGFESRRKVCGFFWFIFHHDLQPVLLDTPDLPLTREPSCSAQRSSGDSTVKQSGGFPGLLSCAPIPHPLQTHSSALLLQGGPDLLRVLHYCLRTFQLMSPFLTASFRGTLELGASEGLG